MLNSISLIGRSVGIQKSNNNNNSTNYAPKLKQLNADTVSFRGTQVISPKVVKAVAEKLPEKSAEMLQDGIKLVQERFSNQDIGYVESALNHISKNESLIGPFNDVLAKTDSRKHPSLLGNIGFYFSQSERDIAREGLGDRTDLKNNIMTSIFEKLS